MIGEETNILFDGYFLSWVSFVMLLSEYFDEGSNSFCGPNAKYTCCMYIWGRILKEGWGLEGGKREETEYLMERSEVVSY